MPLCCSLGSTWCEHTHRAPTKSDGGHRRCDRQRTLCARHGHEPRGRRDGEAPRRRLARRTTLSASTTLKERLAARACVRRKPADFNSPSRQKPNRGNRNARRFAALACGAKLGHASTASVIARADLVSRPAWPGGGAFMTGLVPPASRRRVGVRQRALITEIVSRKNAALGKVYFRGKAPTLIFIVVVRDSARPSSLSSRSAVSSHPWRS
jgi:hypothetical protein